MSLQPLASTGPRDALQFTDGASCRRWVESLPLTNVQHIRQILTAQLAALHAEPVAPLERLKILEALKETLGFVRDEAAKRYAGRALPLDNAEAAAWSNAIALLQELSRNYHLCLKAYREGDLTVAPHAALITMRALQ